MEPLWSAILGFLRHKHVAGATLFRAAGGFGTHEQFHDPQSEYLGEHSPIRIELIETAERVDELLPTLYDMVTDGLITIQDLTVVKSVSKDAKPRSRAGKLQENRQHAGKAGAYLPRGIGQM